MMTLKKLIGIGGMAAACSAFATGSTSDPAFVFLNAETSSFWRTAPGSEVTLPIDFPEGASSATLEVRGTKYSKTYSNITEDEFVLTLPAANGESSEDVYELTLAFDDSTVRTARLGLIKGLKSGGTGVTRCVTDTASTRWTRCYSHAVMPVPYGTTAFTVKGVEVVDGDDGFTGAQGWYALPNLAVGSLVPVALTVDGVEYDVNLTIRGDGTAMFVR